MILSRGERVSRPEPEAFAAHQQNFIQALNAIQEGQELVALTWNGRAMVAITSDSIARKMTNDAFVNGARSSGISGSGSAIIVITPSAGIPPKVLGELRLSAKELLDAKKDLTLTIAEAKEILNTGIVDSIVQKVTRTKRANTNFFPNALPYN